jgi:hypothetical protein
MSSSLMGRRTLSAAMLVGDLDIDEMMVCALDAVDARRLRALASRRRSLASDASRASRAASSRASSNAMSSEDVERGLVDEAMCSMVDSMMSIGGTSEEIVTWSG